MTKPELSVAAPRTPARGPRRRSLSTTAGLAAVLLSLGTFVSWGNLATTRAANAQAEALEVAGLFEQAQYWVAVQELYARQYQLAPSSAVHRRYLDATEQSVRILAEAEQATEPTARQQAQQLMALEQSYRTAADRMTRAVTIGDANVALIDGIDVAPAYFSLQELVNNTAYAYRVAAQRRVAELLRLQRRMLIGTIAGFAAGLFLLSMIWRLVLGYQRNLARHADANEHLALHDPLTGLPNRAYFTQRLHEAISDDPTTRSEPSRSGRRGLPAIMILDLDRFKEVNDTLGHHAGDQLLIEVGRRLRHVLRPQDVVARLGGDEFAILLPAADDVEAAQEVAERAAAALREPFQLDGTPMPVGILSSIGVACWSGEGTLDELSRRADSAMYRAKASHLGVAVYDEALDREDPARLALTGQLRMLLETGDPDKQLLLFYQPQVRLDDARIHGVEALVRWRHPDHGLLPPAEFLPIAEQIGLESALTRQLLGRAVAEAAGWARTGRPTPVAVNVSPPCLLDPGFAELVRQTLQDHALAPDLLRIEVTEGSVMADPRRAREILTALRDTGVGVSVDDFGSGFSSLGQLRRMPVQELKIDKSFIHDLAMDVDDAVLVRTAIDLGHHHGTVVVAEGVEDAGALAILHELGCDVVQGFLLSSPVSPASLAESCAQAQATVRTMLASQTGTVPRPRSVAPSRHP